MKAKRVALTNKEHQERGCLKISRLREGKSRSAPRNPRESQLTPEGIEGFTVKTSSVVKAARHDVVKEEVNILRRPPKRDYRPR